MIKVLHVLNGLGSGGAESIIMNLYRCIDRNKVQFDFLIRSEENIFEEEISSLGGKVYKVSEFPRKYLKNKKETEEFFKEHAKEYSILHVHGNALLYTNIFDIAKKYGVKKRIYHSHSIETARKIYKLLHIINSFRIKHFVERRLACSKRAGEWAFRDLPFTVIKNGIDSERFAYSEEKRKKTREQLGVEGKFVCGHVGRFVDVKNHKFILDVFEEVVTVYENAVLILVGEGQLMEETKNYAKKLGIYDKIMFLGVRKDIAYILQALDVFVLPSKFEGLVIAGVEAQASGLKTLVSENVTEEIIITDNIERLPLVKEIWVEKILEARNYARRDTSDSIIENGYDIKTSAKMLEDLYISMVSDGE